MATTSGTLTIADLKANRFQSVFEFGLDTIVEVLQRDLAAHNTIVNTMVTELCEVTTDRQRIYGTSSSGRMQKADEFDRGVAKKNTGGSTVAFPLHKFTDAIGWTADYMLVMTPADLAESVLAAQRRHVAAVQYELQTAIFTNTNYTFREQFVPPLADLSVKALVNADGAPIPNGPNGEVFDGATHTHYDFLNAAAPTQAAALALISDVIEHGHGNMVKLAIPRAAEDTVRGFANFTPYLDPRLTLRSADAPGVTVDISRIDNRAIGLLGAAEVWVKSWVPSGYLVVYDAGEATKPLCFRQHPAGVLQGLRVAARLIDQPLYADQMESYFGIGVWNRTAAAVLYYANGAGAYVAPTL
jgi:hypothetical protein